jgi:hypothetical protein
MQGRGRPQGDLADQFFGAKVLHDVIDRAIQIHGSPAPVRPAARGDVPARTRCPHVRRRRRGPPRLGGAPDSPGYQPPTGMWPRCIPDAPRSRQRVRRAA